MNLQLEFDHPDQMVYETMLYETLVQIPALGEFGPEPAGLKHATMTQEIDFLIWEDLITPPNKDWYLPREATVIDWFDEFRTSLPSKDRAAFYGGYLQGTEYWHPLI